jgi:hypothetical protein
MHNYRKDLIATISLKLFHSEMHHNVQRRFTKYKRRMSY